MNEKILIFKGVELVRPDPTMSIFYSLLICTHPRMQCSQCTRTGPMIEINVGAAQVHACARCLKAQGVGFELARKPFLMQRFRAWLGGRNGDQEGEAE